MVGNEKWTFLGMSILQKGDMGLWKREKKKWLVTIMLLFSFFSEIICDANFSYIFIFYFVKVFRKFFCPYLKDKWRHQIHQILLPSLYAIFVTLNAAKKEILIATPRPSSIKKCAAWHQVTAFYIKWKTYAEFVQRNIILAMDYGYIPKNVRQ